MAIKSWSRSISAELSASLPLPMDTSIYWITIKRFRYPRTTILGSYMLLPLLKTLSPELWIRSWTIVAAGSIEHVYCWSRPLVLSESATSFVTPWLTAIVTRLRPLTASVYLSTTKILNWCSLHHLHLSAPPENCTHHPVWFSIYLPWTKAKQFGSINYNTKNNLKAFPTLEQDEMYYFTVFRCSNKVILKILKQEKNKIRHKKSQRQIYLKTTKIYYFV